MADAAKLPFKAYEGKEPYIFVSYSHEDTEQVYTDLAFLHDSGCRIWYDEGIPLGHTFPERIQEEIDDTNCAYVVAFLSPRAVESSWVRREIFHADKVQKQLLAVHLEETKLRYGLALVLGAKEAAMRHQMSRTDYCRKLLKAIPPSVIEKQPLGPEEDLKREIIKRLLGPGPYQRDDFLQLGELLGLNEKDGVRVIKQAYAELNVSEDSRKSEEEFHKLVCFFVEHGPLDEDSRRTLRNRAEALHIPTARWEAIVQEEAADKAGDLFGSGQFDEAQKLLVSSVGRSAPQLPRVREMLEGIGKARSAPPPAPEQAAPTRVEPVPSASPSAGSGEEEEALATAGQASTPLEKAGAVEWIRIPGGEVTRGCPKSFIEYVKREYGADTDPLERYLERTEPIDAFWIARTPVTNGQFHSFVRAQGYRFPAGWRGTSPPYPCGDGDKPVTGVTWKDAEAFAKWLDARLPTRAEYEKACRGDDGRLFPWGNEFDADRCNTAEGKHGEILPVGTISEGASPYGVMDLVGNVWQWAADGEGQHKMTVGASYKATGEIYGAAFFDVRRPPESSSRDLGFRLACWNPAKVAPRAGEGG